MNIRKWFGPNPRFRTIDDAEKYMECIKERSPVPQSIWIYPYIEAENLGRKKYIQNPEYRDAPYECRAI